MALKLVWLLGLVVVDCGPPESPANWVVNTSNGTKYGAKAVYNCRSDEFHPEGNHLIRYCQEDGNWSETVPECKYLKSTIINNLEQAKFGMYYIVASHDIVCFVLINCVY